MNTIKIVHVKEKFNFFFMNCLFIQKLKNSFIIKYVKSCAYTKWTIIIMNTGHQPVVSRNFLGFQNFRLKIIILVFLEKKYIFKTGPVLLNFRAKIPEKVSLKLKFFIFILFF